MNKFIQFNDKKIDSLLFMQLSDLGKTLTKEKDFEVDYGYRSYLDPLNKKAIISHFWDNRPKEEMVIGLKSDIYLRCLGNFYHTEFQVVAQYLKQTKTFHIPKFAKQLFMLAEELRIEELVKSERPGTTRSFQLRRKVYRKFFHDQMHVNVVKSVQTDALFTGMYVLLTSESPLEEIPSISESIDLVIPYLRTALTKFYETKSTDDVRNRCIEVIEVLNEVLDDDMLNTYFHLPELAYDQIENDLTFDDLKRKDQLKHEEVLDAEEDEEKETHDDQLPTWHRETSDTTQSFLQFDLEQGSQTTILNDAAREGESGDQAMGFVQGSARKSKQSDYSKLEALDSHATEETGGEEQPYGKENKFAFPVFQDPSTPTLEERKNYQDNKAFVLSYQKKLKQMIQKTLEHKNIAPRSDLHMGRLNKKLIRFVTDENPRLFYKKHEPSNEIDAAFTLLVDCSASMYDKMDETKLGITLFHEALKSVFVPHMIVGFWEDTNDATNESQPNHLKTVIDFHSSIQKKSGPEIMQLQPEEDNRDGFAIRVMTERLLERTEKQKFLLVFSDGEPAALGYEKNGIVDTHEAVTEARKNGIEVINVFLANGEIDEGQKQTIQNIYGKYSILVPDIDKLPDVLFPLLRKLLYKSL